MGEEGGAARGPDEEADAAMIKKVTSQQPRLLYSIWQQVACTPPSWWSRHERFQTTIVDPERNDEATEIRERVLDRKHRTPAAQHIFTS
jgi:hypothetical protein